MKEPPKPCPLCGLTPEIRVHRTDDIYEHNRYQVTLQCNGGWHSVSVCRFAETESTATHRVLKEWNQRFEG
jgi:hypothetical protein